MGPIFRWSITVCVFGMLRKRSKVHQWSSCGSGAARTYSRPTCKGVPTRSVSDLVKAMGGAGVSQNQVGRLCEEIDVKALLVRVGRRLPYGLARPTHVKVRCNHRHRLGRRDRPRWGNADGRRPRRQPSLERPGVADQDELGSSIFQVTAGWPAKPRLTDVYCIYRIRRNIHLTYKYIYDIMVLWECMCASGVTHPPARLGPHRGPF